MFSGASWAPLLHHIVSCASLPLQLLGAEDLVDVVEAVFGGLRPVGVVRRGGVQAEVLGGGEASRGGGAMGVEERRLVELPVMQGTIGTLCGRVGTPSRLDTQRCCPEKHRQRQTSRENDINMLQR